MPVAVGSGEPGSADRVVFSQLLSWSPAPTVTAALLATFVVAEAEGMPMNPRANDWPLEAASRGWAAGWPGMGLSPAMRMMLYRAVRFVLGPRVTVWFVVTSVSALAMANAPTPNV